LVQARFVFNAASASPWFATDGAAHGTVGVDVVARPPVCWRLLSPNNRQLGRSAELFDDLASARVDLDQFRLRLDDVEALVTRHTAPVRWTWRLLLGNRVVAMSGRSFETERQATRTLENFVASAAVASVIPEVVGIPTSRTG
jgi:hypothetical protein